LSGTFATLCDGQRFREADHLRLTSSLSFRGAEAKRRRIRNLVTNGADYWIPVSRRSAFGRWSRQGMTTIVIRTSKSSCWREQRRIVAADKHIVGILSFSSRERTKYKHRKAFRKACPNYNSQKNSEDNLISARGIATIDCRFSGIGPDLFGDGLGGEIGAVLLGLEQEYCTTICASNKH